MQPYLYASLLFLSSLTSAIAIRLALRHHRTPGATALIAMLASLFVWSGCYAVHWLVREPIWKYFWLNMTYFGLAAAPLSFFIFAFRYTQHDEWLTASRIALLVVEPIVILVLMWTDPWHGLYFAGKRALTDSILIKGSPLLWSDRHSHQEGVSFARFLSLAIGAVRQQPVASLVGQWPDAGQMDALARFGCYAHFFYVYCAGHLV